MMSYLCFLCIVITYILTSKIRLPFPKAEPDPKRYFQRFRKDLYTPLGHPYYQWWYFWINDLVKNENYAFAYGMSTCETDCKYNGVYVMFSKVSPGDSFVKYEYYPLEDFKVLDDQSPHISVAGGKFGIEPLDDDHYRVFGNFFSNDTSNVWYVHNAKKDLEVKWDLVFHRVHGWYGQFIFEVFDELIKGMIMWNTYGHTSKISGDSNHLAIDGKELIHSKDPTNFDVYMDGNWGDHFPQGQLGNKNYSWGWYVVKNEPSQESFSFVAGEGQSDSETFLGVMVAKFADIRINGSYELSLRQIEVRKDEKVLDDVFYSSTDGDLYEFKIYRRNWVEYEDALGKAEYPLEQDLVIKTKDFEITVNLTATKENFNRLVFPFQDDLFSDFEGLGVSAKVMVFDKTCGKYVVDLKKTVASGVEFGYKFDTKPIKTPF